MFMGLRAPVAVLLLVVDLTARSGAVSSLLAMRRKSASLVGPLFLATVYRAQRTWFTTTLNSLK